MPRFSQASKNQLATLHPKLQKILSEAILHVDFVIVEGHRGKAAQDAAYAKGNSQVRWPHGKHNSIPSRAVDITPYPVDWSDAPHQIERLCFLAGVVTGIAASQGVKLRWGGDWDSDLDIREERFRDRYHLELAPGE